MNLARSHMGETKSDGVAEDLADLIIRGYSPIASIAGIGYGSAQVEAREGLIPGRQIAGRSVRVELSTGGDYPQMSFVGVDYDHLDKLISVLETLRFTKIDTDRFQFTEIEFEVDGLKVIVFNNANGALYWGLSSENVSVHFNVLSKIGDFKDAVVRAKAHLDRVGLPGQ